MLFSGDALVTLDPASGGTGPQPMRWNRDPAQETASYERLRAIAAELTLPGHGMPWRR